MNAEPFDPDLHGEMIVVQSADTAIAPEKASGCWILIDARLLSMCAQFVEPAIGPVPP